MSNLLKFGTIIYKYSMAGSDTLTRSDRGTGLAFLLKVGDFRNLRTDMFGFSMAKKRSRFTVIYM